MSPCPRWIGVILYCRSLRGSPCGPDPSRLLTGRCLVEHEGLELVRKSGDDRLEGRFLYILMTTAWMQGDVPLARLRAESAIARLRELDDRTWLAWALSDMGMVMSVAGEPERAAQLSMEGVALHMDLGNATGVAINLMDVGAIAHQAGDTATAADAYAESLAIWRDLGESWWSASPLTGVAGLACALSETRPGRTSSRSRREALGGEWWGSQRHTSQSGRDRSSRRSIGAW